MRKRKKLESLVCGWGRTRAQKLFSSSKRQRPDLFPQTDSSVLTTVCIEDQPQIGSDHVDDSLIVFKKHIMSGPLGSMVFRRTSKMCMHRKEKHNIKLRTKRTSVSETQSTASKRRRKSAYPCKICGRLFLHHLSLNAHYTATACLSAIKKGQGTGTDTKTTKLREHRPYNKVKGSLAQGKTVRAGPGRPRQEEEEDDVDVEGEFPCPTCTEVFSLQSQLRQHVELHDTSMVRSECSVCTEKMDTFERPASRRQRFYHCVPCQEGFSTLDSFLEHCQEHLQARDEEED